MASRPKITRIRNGVEEVVPLKEVKRIIMKANNWTAEEYKKKYDIFKNKLRAFEAYEKIPVSKKQSPIKVLYKQAKAMLREGSNYTPSLKMRRINDFTSISSGKKLEEAMTHQRYLEARTATYTDTTYKQFQGLIENNLKAEEIYNTIKDPVKREKALTDFANSLHVKMKQDGQVEGFEAIGNYGEVVGSDQAFDFDLSAYL